MPVHFFVLLTIVTSGDRSRSRSRNRLSVTQFSITRTTLLMCLRLSKWALSRKHPAQSTFSADDSAHWQFADDRGTTDLVRRGGHKLSKRVILIQTGDNWGHSFHLALSLSSSLAQRGIPQWLALLWLFLYCWVLREGKDSLNSVVYHCLLLNPFLPVVLCAFRWRRSTAADALQSISVSEWVRVFCEGRFLESVFINLPGGKRWMEVGDEGK